MSVPTSTPSARNSTLLTPTLSEAVAASPTLPDTVALAAGAVSETVGSVVSAERCHRGDRDRARSRSPSCRRRRRPWPVWYGSRPRRPRRSRYPCRVRSCRCRPARRRHGTRPWLTPTLSEALAARATLPETVALAAGAVSETVGSVVSAGGVVRPSTRRARYPGSTTLALPPLSVAGVAESSNPLLMAALVEPICQSASMPWRAPADMSGLANTGSPTNELPPSPAGLVER